MNISNLLIHTEVLPARKAQYAPFPPEMSDELKSYLTDRGIEALYTHQTEMYERARAGENVVITTSTASGKTLSFLLPVIETILKNPNARAIFLYPTKALAADQMRAFEPVIRYFGKDRIDAGVYDGDTSPQERSRIRRSCNIILTNPEMLSGSFLPNHSRYGFDFLFSNLAYIVIDEMHTYRGVFGSHVANLMRRLTRITRRYRSEPQFLCATATIANPLELAESLCGRKFSLIERDGSPAAKRTYAFLQPPRIEDGRDHFTGQVTAETLAATLIASLVEDDHSLIAFCKSRRSVEVVLREARDKLDANDFPEDAGKKAGRGSRRACAARQRNKDLISGYRGGYTPVERKTIERDMISGKLKGLVSTNALELGIDIGAVDSTILVGFPGTRASFWQETGRAGRRGSQDSATNFLILESLPRDQYVAVNPDWLFTQGNENAVIDPNNLLIELAHIRAAAAELPLTLDDIAIFPDLGEAIPVLLKIGELVSQHGRFAWNGNAYPAGDFSMRGIDEKRYKLMNEKTHEQITEMDELQAFREIHEGAIYLHDSNQYQVLRLDLASRTAWAIPFTGNYYTMPGGQTEVKIIHEQESSSVGCTKASWGDVNVNDIVYMYKKLQFHNHQNLGWEQLPEPLAKDYDTEALWISVPENVVSMYRRLLQPDPGGHFMHNNHFDGLCHAIGQAARMITMAEQEDLGVTVSGSIIGAEEAPAGGTYLYVYDRFAGGLGYAEKAYTQIVRVIDAAIDLVSGCSCRDGCTACVGDYKLDRQVVLWGLRNLREELPDPSSCKYVSYPERPVAHKAYRFAELGNAAVWQKFTEAVRASGDAYGAFLSGTSGARVDGSTLTLLVSSEFYREWVMADENYRALKNVICYYTDAPASLRISVDVAPDLAEESRARGKRLEGKVKRSLERREEERGQ